MRPICKACSRFFKVKKIGVCFIEGMPLSSASQPGNVTPEAWRPYKLWSGDLLECPGCKTEIISGFGLNPISEHYRPDFKSWVEKVKGDWFQVNDCC